jgi:ubiquinone/menaquinone biosynthesis C-methylase UbiE
MDRPADPTLQFGAVAEKYLTSTTHGNEAALTMCIEVANPQGGAVLDVGTGAGHVAYAFAPRASRVVASDPTREMLEIVAREAQNRGLDNIETVETYAENLPFQDGEFEGVTCRLAAHHFEDRAKFVAESFRVLQPGGWFFLEDTIGIPDDASDAALHEIESLRDPSHGRNIRSSEWVDLIQAAGFGIEFQEESSFPQNAFGWLDRMEVAEPTRSQVLHKIAFADGWLREYLRPVGEDDSLTFRLHRIVLLARKP